MANGMGLGILDLIGELSGGPQGIQAQMDETQAGSDVDRLLAALRDQQFEATDPEPISTKRNALGTIASMLSTYAAGQNPRLRPIDFVGDERERRLQDANRQTAIDRQQFQDSRQLALMELRDMIGQRDTAQRRADALGAEGRARVDQRGREQRARDAAIKDREDRQSFEERLQKEIAQIRADARGREVNMKNVPEAKMRVLAVRDQIRSGELDQTPDQIRESFEEALDVLELSEEGRAEAMAYYLEKVEPLLREAEKAKEEADAEEEGRRQQEILEQQRILRERRRREARMSPLAREAYARGGFFGSNKF